MFNKMAVFETTGKENPPNLLCIFWLLFSLPGGRIKDLPV